MLPSGPFVTFWTIDILWVRCRPVIEAMGELGNLFFQVPANRRASSA